MKSFLIIRLSSLGDIIHTLPAFSALRKKFPKAKITWLVEDKGREILELVPGIDKVLVVKAKRWRVGSIRFWREICHLKRELKNHEQIALDFQGLTKSGLLALLSKAQMRIGFHKKNLKEPLASLFYTDRLCKISEKNHVISKNLKLLTRIGIIEEKYEFPLHIPEDLTASIKARFRNLGFEELKKIILVNVGAAWETKRWFAERWADLIERMKRKDHFLLLLWGNEEERKLAEKVHKISNIPMAPYLSLKEVMALIKEASLIISGDTFALQAASALARPVVGIFGPTNPARNGPFGPQDKVAFHELECSYCYKRKCSNVDCLNKITPEEVAGLGLQILRENA